MSGDRQPRLRDRVRWTSVVEGVVEYIDDKTIYINDGGDDPDGNVCVLSMGGATVEVLEPADDPSVGEVRREDHNGGHTIWQVEENEDGHRFWRCTHSTAPGNRGTTLPLANPYEWPVIGAVPGTPAAEQQQPLQPGPRPAPKPERSADAPLPEWEVDRAEADAAKEWRANKVGYDTSDAQFVYNSDLRADGSSIMSFHRVGGCVHIRIHHHDDDRFKYSVAVVEEEDVQRVTEALGVLAEPPMVDASALFPPPVGTAPRVFTSDGPEPPEDVTVVVAVDHGDYPHPYFVRFEDGWSCSPTPVAGGSRLNPVPWRNTQHYGLGSSFREVIS